MSTVPDGPAQPVELRFWLHAEEGIWHLRHGCGREWAIGEPSMVDRVMVLHVRQGCDLGSQSRLTRRDRMYLFVAALCVLWAMVALTVFAVGPRG